VDGSGENITITNAAYRFYNSSREILDAGNLSVNGNEISCTAAGSLYVSSEDTCILKIDMTVNGEDTKRNHYFDVCIDEIHNPLSTKDLETDFPDIQDSLWENQNDYSIQIEEAFQKIKAKIKSLGNRSKLIVVDSQIKPLVKWKAFEIIFRSFVKDENDLWFMQAEYAKTQYEDTLADTDFQYDFDEDGTADEVIPGSGILCQKIQR
jgi:hypothetical protein